MKKKKLVLLGLCVAAAMLLAALPAQAHKVSVYGYVENGMIMGESFFSRGTKAKGATIELLDSEGKVLATTKTDNNGEFKLKLPKAKPPLKLVVNAGMGHKDEYELTADDLGQGQEKQAQDAAASTSGSKKSPAQAVTLDPKQIQTAVEKALDKKLAPLNAQIAKLQADKDPGFPEILGGLGYILGLLGLAAYMKSRKRS